MREAAAALVRLRKGLQVFRSPRRAAWATSAQLAAWGLQLLGAFALLLALNLDPVPTSAPPLPCCSRST